VFLYPCLLLWVNWIEARIVAKMPDCCIRVTEAVGGKPQCPALASWRWL